MSTRMSAAPRFDLVLEDAVRHAVGLAARHAVADAYCVAVYLVDDRVQVLPVVEPRPKGAVVYCIAQRWDADCVQVRREGATSDWVTAPMQWGDACAA